VPRAQEPRENRDLNELGPGADDGEDPHVARVSADGRALPVVCLKSGRPSPFDKLRVTTAPGPALAGPMRMDKGPPMARRAVATRNVLPMTEKDRRITTHP
jgi:hypothetical protein